MEIDPNKLRLDGGTQPRERIDESIVDQYADAMKAGAIFPEPTVFHDGANYWVGDGFHRTRAAIKAGMPLIAIDVKVGDARGALLYACGANAEHGVRRSNEDKRRAVLTMLDDEEWGQWSNERIAKRCRVDPQTVANHRRDSHSRNSGVTERQTVTNHRGESISRNSGDENPRKAIRNGTEYEIKPANIGKRKLIRPSGSGYSVPTNGDSLAYPKIFNATNAALSSIEPTEETQNEGMSSTTSGVANVSVDSPDDPAVWNPEVAIDEPSIAIDDHASDILDSFERRNREKIADWEVASLYHLAKKGVLENTLVSMKSLRGISLYDAIKEDRRLVAGLFDRYSKARKKVFIEMLRTLADDLESGRVPMEVCEES